MEKARRVKSINVGIRPNDMALAETDVFAQRARATTPSMSLTPPQWRVLNGSRQNRPANLCRKVTCEIISTSLYLDSPEGSTPDGLAVSPDGHTLFVANADNNCVAVVDISNSNSEGARVSHRESVSAWLTASARVDLVSSAGRGQSRQSNAFCRQRQRTRLTSQFSCHHFGPPTFAQAAGLRFQARTLTGRMSLFFH